MAENGCMLILILMSPYLNLLAGSFTSCWCNLLWVFSMYFCWFLKSERRGANINGFFSVCNWNQFKDETCTLFYLLLCNMYDFFMFLNFCSCDRLVQHIRVFSQSGHQYYDSFLFSLAQQTTHLLVDFFLDVPGTMPGKQHVRSWEGLGDFDGRPLVAGSTTQPNEDRLSANVRRKSNLETLPPFLSMMNAFRQTKSRRQWNIIW
jgi:hypothetical protein